MPETLGRQADAGTSGNMQLDTPESVEFPKAFCFIGRLLAGVFLMQGEVKGPCFRAFFFFGRHTHTHTLPLDFLGPAQSTLRTSGYTARSLCVARLVANSCVSGGAVKMSFGACLPECV